MLRCPMQVRHPQLICRCARCRLCRYMAQPMTKTDFVLAMGFVVTAFVPLLLFLPRF